MTSFNEYSDKRPELYNLNAILTISLNMRFTLKWKVRPSFKCYNLLKSGWIYSFKAWGFSRWELRVIYANTHKKEAWIGFWKFMFTFCIYHYQKRTKINWNWHTWIVGAVCKAVNFKSCIIDPNLVQIYESLSIIGTIGRKY